MQSRSLWIDPQQLAAPPRAWRKVHLDFHNSHHMPAIGTAFDAEQFGETLAAAHVSEVVLFAKDMHGYFYYPSQYGPVHPGLDVDLLGSQVEACHRRGIRVSAYYCTTWDNYLAEHHPEWLVFTRERMTYLPRFNETPGFTALCLAHDDFVELMLAHSREFLSCYPLDGVWYDTPVPRDGECFCAACLEAFRKAGASPFDLAAQRRHKEQLLLHFMHRAYELAHTLRPGCQVDQNSQTRFGLGERVVYLDNIDIEALPTASWGYLYFPTAVRYARTFGRSVYGQTGRFHRSWGDFGGLKLPQQLQTELAGIVAQGAHCCIGDQMPPTGRLDPAVYATIGRCYSEIAALEPYLEHAAPVVEAAIVCNGPLLSDPGHRSDRWAPTLGPSVLGLTKLLIEHHIQFDIIEEIEKLDRYQLLVLADDLQVDALLGAALNRFLHNGGAVIASHNAVRLAESSTPWSADVRWTYDGESPFQPAYLKLDPSFAIDLPDYEYALYEGAARWTPPSTSTAEVVGFLGEPLFQRSPEHYTSHAQTPFDHVTSSAALVIHNRFAAAAFPFGRSYYRHGYWIYRTIFGRFLQRVFPQQLIKTNAPLSTEVSITFQRATATHPARWTVHLVNFSPNRRSPEHPEYYESPIPLYNVRVDLRLPAMIARAYYAPRGESLTVTAQGDSVSVILPCVNTSAAAVLEEQGNQACPATVTATDRKEA